MAKKNIWFIAVRGSYLPKSAMGMLLFLLYVTYLVALFIVWYKHGHSGWDLLVFVIPLSVAAATLMQNIASRHVK